MLEVQTAEYQCFCYLFQNEIICSTLHCAAQKGVTKMFMNEISSSNNLLMMMLTVSSRKQ